MALLPGTRTRTRVLVGAGVGAVALAYLIAAVPENAPQPIRGVAESLRAPIVGAIRDLGKEAVTWLLALVAGGFALFRLVQGRDAPAVAPAFVDRPPEEPPEKAPTPRESFESDLKRVTYWIEDPRTGGEELRRRIREDALEVVERTGGDSPDEAREAVDSGSWTDDRIAAAFLGDDSAPGYPLRARFRGWLRPDVAYQRRVERTIEAIHRRMEEG